jgi:serine/threonine-protein kinase
MSDKAPAKIGRYPVTRMLGRGAMGCVYLARDTELDRDVAIKTVRQVMGTAEEQESFLVRFRNEARAVGRLKHPSIVAIYDVGKDREAGPYLVFEYIEGATLKDVLRNKGPLSPTQLIELAEQVGDALSVAHREGIIHRDIKPENLIIGNDGLTRLLDFGIARVPDAALTGEGQFLGTPCYGAPETLRGGGDYGPKSDQFSLAAVLYEAATGTRAFPGKEAVAVAHSVVHDEPELPSAAAVAGADVPPALDDVLMRGLSKRPEQRFESIAALVAALRGAYRENAPTSAVADTVQMPRMRTSSVRESQPPAPVPRRRIPLWPFAAAFAFGSFAVWQLAPSEPASGADVEADERPSDRSRRDQDPLSLAPADAAPAGTLDAQLAPAPDAASAEAEHASLSAFEREERAKDALDRAQRALEAGDRATARKALDEAFRFDPEHPDIEALRRKL